MQEIYMSQNDRIILDQVIDEGHQEVGQSLSKSEYFEVFTAEQILKDFEVSPGKYNQIKNIQKEHLQNFDIETAIQKYFEVYGIKNN